MIRYITLFYFFGVQSAPTPLVKMRELFSTISKNEKSVIALKEITQTQSTIPSEIKRAYYAAAHMASAQYKLNIITKINIFNEGKEWLESIIKSDTTSIELRYIRLAIQENTPSVLGYNKSILLDKRFLITRLSSIKMSDPDLYIKASSYLLLKSKLSRADKALMNK